MDDRESGAPEQVAKDTADHVPEDLVVREDSDEVRGGRTGDPDVGGQAKVTISNRLASNSNETVVDDDL